jgi:hypothetical protein
MAKNSHKTEGIDTKSQQVEIPRAQGENELSVLQKGNRLQITADIDLEGIVELKDILGHYEAILQRLSVRKLPSTGVSFLITHHQKAELRELGFTCRRHCDDAEIAFPTDCSCPRGSPG